MFPLFLFSLLLETSLSIRTPKEDSVLVDYEISFRIIRDSLLSIELERERDSGINYTNIEIFTWQYWKFLQLSGKYIYIQEDDLTVCSVDLRYKYGSHSIGIAEVWDLQQTTNIVA